MTTNTPVSRACALVGGVSALARAVGVKPPTVSQWASGIRPVPVERCLAIEVATGGAVKRQELRPNDFHLIWPDLPSPTVQGNEHV